MKHFHPIFKKSIFSLTVVCLSSYSFSSMAEIREAKSMTDILSSLDHNTALVFDLDNTVMEPVQTLGSDQFFGFLLKKAQNQGLEKSRALACALKNATLVQPVSQVRPVEKLTPYLISYLQNQGIPMVGLTARPLDWKENTLKQLDSVAVDFTRTPFFPSDTPVGPTHAGLYYHGVIFMDKEGDKGEYLVSFLKQAGSNVTNVIFVDDKIGNVQSIENALNKTNLNHVSFRYGAADPEVQSFRADIAGLEWNYFLQSGNFLNDTSAEEIINQGGGIGDWSLDCAGVN